VYRGISRAGACAQELDPLAQIPCFVELPLPCLVPQSFVIDLGTPLKSALALLACRWLDVSDNLIEALPLQVLQSSLQLEVLKVGGNKLAVLDALALDLRADKTSTDGGGSSKLG